MSDKEKQSGFKYGYLIVIPMLMLAGSVGYLVYGYSQTGEWFLRSIDLKGGTLINVPTADSVDILALESELSAAYGDLSVREIRRLSGYGILIQAGADADADAILLDLDNRGIPTDHASVETIGPSLGESFWYQAQVGIMISFVLMGIIVFLIFRTVAPSVAVILAGVSDIIVTLALMQVFQIELTLPGLAAILMLIGYSIDTDILLTTRTIRTGEGTFMQRVKSAFKTGITMSLTTMAVLTVLLLSSISPVLSQIATVLLIGLLIDLVNTWIQNTSILGWYVKRKGI